MILRSAHVSPLLRFLPAFREWRPRFERDVARSACSRLMAVVLEPNSSSLRRSFPAPCHRPRQDRRPRTRRAHTTEEVLLSRILRGTSAGPSLDTQEFARQCGRHGPRRYQSIRNTLAVWGITMVCRIRRNAYDRIYPSYRCLICERSLEHAELRYQTVPGVSEGHSCTVLGKRQRQRHFDLAAVRSHGLGYRPILAGFSVLAALAAHGDRAEATVSSVVVWPCLVLPFARSQALFSGSRNAAGSASYDRPNALH